MNLSERFDPKRDSAEGQWTRNANGIASRRGRAVLRFPYEPPEEYDFRIEFTPTTEEAVWLLLPRGDWYFLWLMHGGDEGSGFFRVPRGGGLKAETDFRQGQRYAVRIEVRAKEVRACVDDKVVHTIPMPPAGKITKPTNDMVPGDPSTIGLVTFNAAAVIHRIEIAEVKGKGVWKGEPIAVTPAAAKGSLGPPKLVVPPPVLPVGPINQEAVPSAAQQTTVQKVLKDLYGAVPADPAQRQDRVAKLLTQGLDMHNDAASRYVLLRNAMDLSAGAGDVPTAMRAADEMSRYFVVPPDAKVETLRKAVAAARQPEPAKAATACCLEMIAGALGSTDYDLAAKLMPSAESAARAARDPVLTAAVGARSAEVRSWQQESTRAKAAVDKLAAKPDDPDANLALGRFLCLAKGDWPKGLPRLAKGAAGPLQSCAVLELAAGQSSAQKTAIGDAWWDIAEKDKTPFARSAMNRSSYWYQQALADPQIIGLVRIKMQKRVEQARGASPASAP